MENGPGIWQGLCDGARGLLDTVSQLGDMIHSAIQPLLDAGSAIAGLLGFGGNQENSQGQNTNQQGDVGFVKHIT